MKNRVFLSKILILLLSLSLFTNTFTKEVLADSFSVVTLGADLTDAQKEEMLKYFGVTENSANILEITSKEEYEYLGSMASKEQLGTKSISCSFVEPTKKGGLNINVHNITWVSEGIIRNALITAGITNADVKVAAPFKVSGTAALTGILKGFERSENGEEISEDKKEVANEELFVTGQLGEKIGQDEAAELINDIKTEVIKDQPQTQEDIETIVSEATNNFGIELTEEEKAQVTVLMKKINDLELDFSKLKGALNDAANKLKEALSSEEAQSFFAKVKDFFINLWNSTVDFLSNLFNSDKNSSNNTLTDVEPNNSQVNTSSNETKNSSEGDSSSEAVKDYSSKHSSSKSDSTNTDGDSSQK